MKKVNAFVCGLIVLLAFACGKENEPKPENIPAPVPAETRCLLLQDSSSQGRVNKYQYDSEGRLTWITRKIENRDPYYESLEYDAAGKLIRTNSHFTDSTIVSYITFQYNNSGQLSSFTYFGKQIQGGAFVEGGRHAFTYSQNGKVMERSVFQTPQSTAASSFYRYIHSNNKIEENYYTSSDAFGNFRLQYIYESTYDTYKSSFTSLGNFVITQNFFNENNLIAWRNYDLTKTHFTEITYTYQYNAEGYPTKAIWFDGPKQLEGFYKYSCQ